MTCKYCGGELSPEDVRCPHCNRKNTFAAVHRASMKHYQAAYGETKEQVQRKTSAFQTRTLWILMAALLCGGFLFWMLWGALRDDRQQAAVNAGNRKNYDEIVAQIEEYLTAGDYSGLTRYSREKELLDDKGVFKGYYPILYAARFYASVERDIETDREHYQEETDSSMDYLEILCSDLDSFYDATYLNGYEEIEGAVNGENQTILETMKADMSALLQEKLGISTETTANFDELTGAGREQILREELGQADEKTGE